MLFNIQDLVDDRLCYEKIRELRWLEGVKCPHCGSKEHKRHGHHNNCEHRYRYQCKKCGKYYDDLSNTVSRTSSTSKNMDFVFVFDGFKSIKPSNCLRIRT